MFTLLPLLAHAIIMAFPGVLSPVSNGTGKSLMVGSYQYINVSEEGGAMAHYINDGAMENCCFVKISTLNGPIVVIVTLYPLPAGAELYINYMHAKMGLKNNRNLSQVLAFSFPPTLKKSVKLLAYGGKKKKIVGGHWVNMPVAGDTVLAIDCNSWATDTWATADYFICKQSAPSSSKFFVLLRPDVKATKTDKKKGKTPLINHFNLFNVRPDFTQLNVSQNLAALIFETLPKDDQCLFLHGIACQLMCEEGKPKNIRKNLMVTSRTMEAVKVLADLPKKSPVLSPASPVRAPSPSPIRTPSPPPPPAPIKKCDKCNQSRSHSHDTVPYTPDRSRSRSRTPRNRSFSRSRSPPTTPTSIKALNQKSIDYDFGHDGMASSIRPLEIVFDHPECKSVDGLGCGDAETGGLGETLEKMLELLPVEKRGQWAHACTHFLLDCYYH